MPKVNNNRYMVAHIAHLSCMMLILMMDSLIIICYSLGTCTKKVNLLPIY